MARKNSVVSVSIADNLDTITFAVEGQKPIVLIVADLNSEVTQRAMVHGLVQKISDAAALPKNDDGTPASPEDKYNAMLATAERLQSGEWNKRGETTGESAPSGLIRRAVIEWAVANGRTEAKAIAFYEAKDRAGQLALRKVPEIAAIMERIKAERGASKASTINADDLLAEIG